MINVIRSLVVAVVVFVNSVEVCADGSAADWIWASHRRDVESVAFFRKSFVASQDLVTAQLRVVGDFCDATVYLNGRQVAVAENYGSPVQVDVTSLVQPKANLIAVRAAGSHGPSAVAVRLEMIIQNGSARWVCSDTTWRTSVSEQAGWEQPSFTAEDWQPPASFGTVDDVLFGDSASDVAIRAVDDYTQWKQALGTQTSTDPASFLVPEHFRIELLRSAREDEGSWVSLAFDPQGRLIIAKEDKGLLRLMLSEEDGQPIRVETINESLEECRGLLFVSGDLFVNANNSKGLYRLRDTNSDDQIDEIKLLYHSSGGIGHGRNDLALGPDGMIYSIHGDAVDLPRQFGDATSLYREHRRGVRTSEGHLIRMDRDGNDRELLAGGMRNPFGIDFNLDGELFTYDADAEHDMGTPWYRPTRVLHLLRGGDYGWRGVTRQWPPYFPDHPDAAPFNLDIGKGSPTAVKFGTKSQFPTEYRQALFILDWAYGRIIAVQMMPRGASYACRAETFVRGRPLNVTDLDFGPDGAMYVATGGRKTQSGLYRITYVGPPTAHVAATPQRLARDQHAVQARGLRRHLESFHGRQDSRAIDTAWPHLDSRDPWLRHAARIAVEHQPVGTWAQRALTETRPTAALTALMSLAASGDKRLSRQVLTKLNAMPLDEFSTSQKLIALRAYELCLDQFDELDRADAVKVIERLNTLFSDHSPLVNQATSGLLVRLDAPDVVGRTLELLAQSPSQEEQLHYLFVLRNVQSGWTSERRTEYFRCLARTEDFTGGEGMPTVLQRIEEEALASLPVAERAAMKAILDRAKTTSDLEVDTVASRPLVRNWTMGDLVDWLPEVGRGRDFAQGKKMFAVALCARCHRLGDHGTALGPDLTAASSRFSRRDVLESILTPSKVVAEQYQSDVIEMVDGRVLVGSIVLAGDYRLPVLRLALDPLAPEKVVEILKKDVVKHEQSPISRMPQGLLNTLNKAEILDLLAYLETAGDANRPCFDPTEVADE